MYCLNVNATGQIYQGNTSFPQLSITFIDIRTNIFKSTSIFDFYSLPKLRRDYINRGNICASINIRRHQPYTNIYI